MFQGRAIYVPRHGVIERVRSVRFVNRSHEPRRNEGHLNPIGQSVRATTIEVWPGNYYGDLDGEMIARQTTADTADFVFGEAGAPVVEPERSLVALVQDPPERWEVVFESVADASSERAGSFRFVIDNFGTCREEFTASAKAPDKARTPALAHAS